MIERQLLPVHRTRIRIGGAEISVTESAYSGGGRPARDQDELADALADVGEHPAEGLELLLIRAVNGGRVPVAPMEGLVGGGKTGQTARASSQRVMT
jgi:hypothetical protein